MTDNVTLIRMIHMDTKKVAMVHPLEQLNYYNSGYRKAKVQDVQAEKPNKGRARLQKNA